MAKKLVNTENDENAVETDGCVEITPEELRWQCPQEIFKFKNTTEVPPLEHIVGQPRAIEAIRLGASLNTKGYNIFVTGLSGTGRLTTVQKLLEEINPEKPSLFDYCYVNNFENPDEPILIKMPAGFGRMFSSVMNETINYLKKRLPKTFEEEAYQASRRNIIEIYQVKERDILSKFDEKIKPFNFIRGQLETEQGAVQPEVFPLIEGKPVSIDALAEYIEKGTITKEQAEEMKKLYQQFHGEIFDLARQGLKLMQEYQKTMAENDKATAQIVVNTIFDEFKTRFSEVKVFVYIDEVKKYILDNLSIFLQQDNPAPQNADAEHEPKENGKFNIFKVNVVLDNSNAETAPIIVETTPSYTNLFGTIERTFDSRGYWRTDFNKIKAGAILRADQGYLIVNAMDLLTEQGVWPALKRVLLYNKLEIQPFESLFQLSQLHLKPEPIEVNVKVIIIGGQTLYQQLYLYEKGFKKIFKVNAQFDYETERTEEMLQDYAMFFSKICREENLPPCTPDGVAALIEWAVEHSGTQKRITLKFSDVADVLRESAYYVPKTGERFIDRSDVTKALQWRRNRNDLIDDKLKNSILNGDHLIDTDGKRVGQINGLTILSTGILSFGKPARITSSISAGSSGIINIEREVDMSGAIHNKGVLIITGFIRSRFAAKKPMTLSASIAFEQSYSGIDGDSASVAEIYVLLSAISGIPLRQDLAVTGSLNQQGDVQPIGGVNDKIRGFYEICEERGLTGKQGVVIPAQNVKDLMLCEFIIKAVREKKFHIYPISRIEDGIELFFGKKPGEPLANGSYPRDTVFGIVEKRLDDLRKATKESSSKENGGKKKNSSKK